MTLRRCHSFLASGSNHNSLPKSSLPHDPKEAGRRPEAEPACSSGPTARIQSDFNESALTDRQHQKALVAHYWKLFIFLFLYRNILNVRFSYETVAS